MTIANITPVDKSKDITPDMTLTPGEWYVGVGDNERVNFIGSPTKTVVGTKGGKLNVSMGDAKAIAAIPEMLDLIERMMYIDNDPYLTANGLRNVARTLLQNIKGA